MRNLNEKKEVLKGIIDILNDQNFQESLIRSYMKDTGFVRKNIYEREILTPIRIIQSIGDHNHHITPFPCDNRKPLGKIVVMLPSNGVNMMLAKCLSASFLAGNETVLKFPRRLQNAIPVFKQLIDQKSLNVSFADDHKPSKDFLLESLYDPAIKAIVIYGDDRWIGDYKNIARRTRTKIIFEGPGNDPQVVFEDADLDLAVEDAVKCGILNGGQSCSALERFFVHENIFDVFLEKLCNRLSKVVLGNPNEHETDLSIVRSKIIPRRLQDQITSAIADGAILEFGGELIQLDGFEEKILEPTVLSNCNIDMDVVKDENFGPVFPLIKFNGNTHRLIEMLDTCKYGLNASAYGSCPIEVKEYLESSHRNIYYDSTVTTIANNLSRILDGGYKNSGIVWEWSGHNFIQREGRRYLLQELSLA